MRMRKILLKESEIPKKWYNILPDMPSPVEPPLDPETKKPVAPEKLAAIFPPALLEQEVSQERYIEIPEEILEIYTLWRPTPLYRAYNLEKVIETHSRIYYKYEGVSPPGSHKPNTAVAQVYYNKLAGIKKLTTETGAGQWGSALSFAGSLLDMEIKVYMVKVSYEQKPYRRILMESWGAKVVPSPSEETQAGKKVLEEDPSSPGSLGIAISEAIEEALQNEKTNYSLGSVLNHVLLHQTIIGEEAKLQLNMVGEYPDIVIGSCGGGSNFAGISFPFLRDKFAGKDLRVIAVEPTACPTLTRGRYAYDYGDIAGFTPLIKMYTLGHKFVPPPIHAGGLRYHGDAPLVSSLYHHGIIEASALEQNKVFELALTFARAEGILPAPESAHAVAQAILEAKKADEEGKTKTILFNLSGHGYFDLSAYDKFLRNELEDTSLKEEDLEKALASIPS